jgi:hypothetical protein
MKRGWRAATGVSLACAALAASVVLGAGPAMSADGPAPVPGPSPTFLGDPADPFGPAAGDAGGSAGDGPSTVGQVTGAVVAPLFDRLRLAAAYVVGSTEPSGAPAGGASASHGATGAGAAWTPPADLRAPKVVSVPTGAASGPTALTTDQLLWAAYVSAAKRAPTSCHLPVTLLAAIGEVESSSLRGRSLDARHDVVPPVIGPALSGNGFAAIRDTDGGRLDGDPVWDHAVGPMQFIPSTWRVWGADGNGDGVADPQNIEDATLAAARYLCAGGRDLSRAADLASAVLSYNGSQRYLATVIGLMDAMTSGADAAP